MKYLMHVEENGTKEPVEIIFSPKSITIKALGEKPFYTNGCIDELWDKGKIRIYISSDKGVNEKYLSNVSNHKVGKHLLIDWKDGTYTFYPTRAGIPYFLEPMI